MAVFFEQLPSSQISVFIAHPRNSRLPSCKSTVSKVTSITVFDTVLFGPRLSIPYRTGRYGRNILYRPAIRYTRPPCFIPEKIPGVPASYRPISGNTGWYRAYRPVQKKVFILFFIFILFLSFVIFDFLLGQNGNLFALTYQYYLFFQYAMVTFKLSIFFFPFN